MNIQYLLDAAAFLESHSSLPLDQSASWTVGNFSTSSSPCVGRNFSSASGSGSSESSSSTTSSTTRDADADSSNGQEPKVMRRFKGKNSRETHNRLEKSRRAYLRECFANLRRAVQIEDPKCSNLAILQSAIRCIQNLKRKEKQFEQETACLAKRKIELQQKIGELKRDLSDRNPDPSFDVNLWLKMHVNAAAAASSSSSSLSSSSTTTRTDAAHSSDESTSQLVWNHHLPHHQDHPRGGDPSPRRAKRDADSESTSTVSIDENSKEPIFSDTEESGESLAVGRKQRFVAATSARRVGGTGGSGVVGGMAKRKGNLPPTRRLSSSSLGGGSGGGSGDAPFVAICNSTNSSTSSLGHFETVIEENSTLRVTNVDSSQVLTTGSQNVAFMTPDGGIILADDPRFIGRGSNFIIVQPSGFSAYETQQTVVREQNSLNNDFRNLT